MAGLIVTQAQWDEMAAHVSACAPEEACGLIGGVDGQARRVVAVENSRHSPVAYAMEPEGQVRAMMAFEAEGLELLAIFHSHPAGPAGPSQTDVRQAYYPESLYLILSPAPGGGWQGRAFRIDGGAVVEEEFIVGSHHLREEHRMSKVILVVSDGLRDDTAAEQMGFLEHMVEHGLATRYTVRAEMPTVSRVLYETIHTGMPPYQHGITSNAVARLSNVPNLFGLASQAGLVTAAVAYNWYSELYNRCPFDPVDDKEVDDPSLPIQHGRFFVGDEYPDKDLLALATAVARKYSPDYLLIHPMGMDHHGETYGGESSEYRNHAIHQDQIYGVVVPDWLARGYTVLITADHGVNKDRSHGGTRPDVRHVPLYAMRPGQPGRGNTGEIVAQLRIAPTVMGLLGLPVPETMAQPPLEI